MGFCLFNNVAVAAAAALESVRRVAIVDWDVHHGNGTQAAFYGTDRVLYCSVHRRFHFPGSGWYDERGAGDGLGYTLNAPLAAGGTGADYRHVFESVFCPAVAAFAPDLVLVSAGQDPLADDPLGGMALAPADFGAMTPAPARGLGSCRSHSCSRGVRPAPRRGRHLDPRCPHGRGRPGRIRPSRAPIPGTSPGSWPLDRPFSAAGDPESRTRAESAQLGRDGGERLGTRGDSTCRSPAAPTSGGTGTMLAGMVRAVRDGCPRSGPG